MSANDEKSKADRRAFLLQCGRFAIVTPPVVSLLLTVRDKASAEDLETSGVKRKKKTDETTTTKPTTTSKTTTHKTTTHKTTTKTLTTKTTTTTPTTRTTITTPTTNTTFTTVTVTTQTMATSAMLLMRPGSARIG